MLELMVKGGWIMWPLLVCSIAAAVLFLERVFHLHRAQIKQDDFLSGIYTIVNRGNTAEAVSICDQTPGPVAHIIRTGLLHADEKPEELKQTITKAGLGEIPRLEKNLGGLLTIAQITPLLGLLGTVVGLIQIFTAMQQNAPLAEIGDLSEGIWQALITTAVGLCVSIPAFAGYNFLLSRVERITLNMEYAAEEVYHFLVYDRTEGGVDGNEAL
ncbi:MotA/TolQ/ExbB proton channel family protein [Pontiella agarivorans]|uniref:MotA/TolQ/ExbB proton channel family protein n=1 Tax=Pontiella agarivorans TaxID=3038953 RepID=A0ABU5MZW6_9BACT|nr:MotA/TolQ/ExbB proton channel family protein [Pontiella agarivorans]MDZ8119754.1 MotA/TolQ/ExbB proton channel family protein [Pontiella agarivorans]